MLKQVMLCFVISVSFLLCTPDLGYGPFNMLLTGFDVCFGPKAENCANLTAKIIGKNVIYINNKIFKNCNPSKGRIVTSTNGKELAKFLVHKPCEHLFIKPMLVAVYNMTKDCIILKGEYKAKIDIGKIATSYFGGKFFYGNITVRAQLFNDGCNFSCVILRLAMTPK